LPEPWHNGAHNNGFCIESVWLSMAVCNVRSVSI